MLRNYFKIAWRNLVRNKVHSAINVVGLAFSMATCLLIGQYVVHELSYDNFHQKADRIFRLTTLLTTDGKEDHVAWAPNFIGQQLLADYPEVEQIIRLQTNQSKMVFSLPAKLSARRTERSPRLINVDQIYNVYDPAFFQVFTYPMLEGDPKTALSRPGSVVITENVAQNLFGLHWRQGKSVVGQVVQSGGNSYQITGVLRAMPTNTDLPFQALLAQDAKKLEAQAWCITYALFKQAENGISFLPKLSNVAQKIQPDFAKRGGHIAFDMENLRDVHVGTIKTFDTPKANSSYLIILSFIAGFLLLIASINYINLTLTQVFRRSQEVGIRKVTGAGRAQLLVQFVGESVLLSSVALALSLLLVSFLLPVFNSMADTDFSFVSLINWPLVSILLLIFVVVGVVAGSYPAFYLTSLNPVKSLKSSRSLHGKSAKGLVGQGLVVVQFTVLIGIVIGTLMLYKQIDFWQTKPLGFHSEQVLVVNIPQETANESIATLKANISGLSAVQTVALSGPNSLPSQGMNLAAFNVEKSGRMLPLPQHTIDIDESYLGMLGIPVVAGRNFSAPKRTNNQSEKSVHEVIVNEALVARMGWKGGPEAAIGKQLSQGLVGAETWRGRIIGVTKNFHFQSLQKPIEPMVLQNDAGQFPEKLMVRLAAGTFSKQIGLIEDQWRNVLPDSPFEFAFLDATFDRQYRQEERLTTIFMYASLLTILIACLGLYGLSTFAAEQRTKEIGVRKVLGADVASIVTLLSKDFLSLVLIAILIATPVAWFLMNQWLRSFAYHVELSWRYVALAGALAVLVALASVVFQALRAALANPVKSLRSE